MTFEDGRKIVAPTWSRTNYEGLADMPLGSKVLVTYQASGRGTPHISSVCLLDVPQEPLVSTERKEVNYGQQRL